MSSDGDHSSSSLTSDSYCASGVYSKQCTMSESYRINPHKLLQIPLVPLDCSFGHVTENTDGITELNYTIMKERKKQQADVTLLFAIRRAGCGSCREHAMQLLALEKEDKKLSLIGVVKDTKHESALVNFYDEYYKRPIYCDKRWEIFSAMGGRKVNPLSIVSKHVSSIARRRNSSENKSIENQVGSGEMWTQGGVLVFDKRGELRFTYYETYGDEIDLVVLREAVKQARIL